MLGTETARRDASGAADTVEVMGVGQRRADWQALAGLAACAESAEASSDERAAGNRLAVVGIEGGIAESELVTVWREVSKDGESE